MRSAREFKSQLFEQIAAVASALVSPKRLELVDLLAQGERSVEALASEASLSVANASRHLQVLKAARLVATRRQGLHVFYRLAAPSVLAGYRQVRGLAEERRADLRELAAEYFGAVDGLEPIALDDLLGRIRRRDVVVLDVRPTAEYAAGHIDGALSLPLAELERCLGELPPDVEVVAYCRGRYCVLAAEAVRLLRRSGRPARRLAEGFPEWRDSGFPVAATRSSLSPTREKNG